MTSPSTIRDLRAALEELEEKKREIDEQYRNVAAALRYFEESVQGPRPQTEEASTSNLGDAIYEVLSVERPLHRRNVYERMVEMRINVGGLPSVDSQLSRDPRFRNVGKGMWDLSEPPVQDEREGSRVSNLGDAIHEVLTAERPLHRRQVYERLVEMGISIGGQTPVDSVGARLSTDPRFKNVGGGVWDLSEPPVQDERKGARVRLEPSRVSNLGDAIHEVLTAERPLHRRQVYERLVEMGMTIPGQDPVNNVGAHLSLDPRFMSVGGGVWDLADPPERDESGRPEPVDFEDGTGRPGRALEDDDDQYEGDEEDSVPW